MDDVVGVEAVDECSWSLLSSDGIPTRATSSLVSRKQMHCQLSPRTVSLIALLYTGILIDTGWKVVAVGTYSCVPALMKLPLSACFSAATSAVSRESSVHPD